jgi:hypothetical protein
MNARGTKGCATSPSFAASHGTGFYYTFIGVSQLTAALLLLIPRTALLAAILYFPIISIALLGLCAVEIRSASCIIERRR